MKTLLLRDDSVALPDPGDEARGDARDTVGDYARGTHANPTGRERTDCARRHRARDEPDIDLGQYDRDGLD